MAVTYTQEMQEVPDGADHAFAFELYEADGETPLAVDGTNDGFYFRVWATDGSAAAIEATKVSSTSFVTVTTAGTAGVTPAKITVTLGRSHTAALVAGTRYYGELVLVDDSDNDYHKSLCKFPIEVVGRAS